MLLILKIMRELALKNLFLFFNFIGGVNHVQQNTRGMCRQYLSLAGG